MSAPRPESMSTSPVNSPADASHETLVRVRVLDDRDRAFEHDVKAEIPVAFGEQHVARTHGAPMSARGEGVEVRLVEDGKGDLLFARHVATAWKRGLAQPCRRQREVER